MAVCLTDNVINIYLTIVNCFGVDINLYKVMTCVVSYTNGGRNTTGGRISRMGGGRGWRRGTKMNEGEMRAGETGHGRTEEDLKVE